MPRGSAARRSCYRRRGSSRTAWRRPRSRTLPSTYGWQSSSPRIRFSGTDSAPGGGYPTPARGRDTGEGLGDADALHEKRVAASSGGGGGGVDAVLRAEVRRGRGAVERVRTAARLRLR